MHPKTIDPYLDLFSASFSHICAPRLLRVTRSPHTPEACVRTGEEGKRALGAGLVGGVWRSKKAITITYNSRDSLLVTHATTSRPIHGLNIGERTGTVIFHDLWS
jgi:hypothetical protein